MALTTKLFSDLITFTRSTGGGRFNAQGQYEWLPANQPRLDFDPVTGEAKGLLIEEQRTNLLRYSSDAQVTQWSKSGMSVAVATIISPSGTASAKKLIPTSGVTYTNINMSVATSVSGAYCLSVYAKAAEISTLYLSVTNTSTVGVSFNLSAKTAAVVGSGPVGNIEDVGGGWFRCSVTLTLSAQNAHALIQPRPSGSPGVAGDGTSGIYIWGAQLEAGSFPTSYIPTTTAQVTRAADVASVNVLSPWFNASEGTFVLESTNRQVAKGGTFGLSIGSSSSNYIGTPYHTTSGVSASVFAAVGGVGKNLSISQNPDKVAFSYGSDGVIALAAGGVSYGSITHAALPSFGSLFIGRGHFGGAVAQAHYKSIRYFPRALSNTELQAMTQ